MNELAELLATCSADDIRDGDRAISLAQQSCELANWDEASYVDTLACACAEAGDFTAAIRYGNQAVNAVDKEEQPFLKQYLQQHLQLFESGKPYRETTPSMVAWWRFEHVDNGRVLDASGNQFDGSLTGDAEIIADLERGNVLSLQGNGYVGFDRHQILNITGPMTFSYWVKIDAETQVETVVIDTGGVSCIFRYNGAIGTHHPGLDSWWIVLRSFVKILDQKWHHVVSSYDGTKMFLYVDGRLDKSRLATGFMTSTDLPLCIGASSATKDMKFTGLMDDLRVYNYALPETEIKALCIEKGSEEREW